MVGSDVILRLQKIGRLGGLADLKGKFVEHEGEDLRWLFREVTVLMKLSAVGTGHKRICEHRVLGTQSCRRKERIWEGLKKTTGG